MAGKRKGKHIHWGSGKKKEGEVRDGPDGEGNGGTPGMGKEKAWGRERRRERWGEGGRKGEREKREGKREDDEELKSID